MAMGTVIGSVAPTDTDVWGTIALYGLSRE